jgi:RND family efflux transporter MFP subunit
MNHLRLTVAVCWLFPNALWAADQQAIAITAEQQQAFGITIAPLAQANAAYGDKLPAKVVVPNAQLKVVSATQSGLIEQLFVAVGDVIKVNQPLASIKSPDLVALQRDFLQAQTQARLSKTHLERDQRLSKEGIIAERRYQESSSAYQEAATMLAQRKEALRLAGMSEPAIKTLEQDRTLTSSLTVVAPLDGTVLEQMAVAGQRVDAASPLYRVGDLQPLWLEIHAPLEKAQGTRLGSMVQVADLGIEGRVITVGREVHEADQGILIRAEVSAGAERLSPGQFVQVRLTLADTAGRYFSVPRNAIVRQRDRAFVFIKSAEGFRPVSIDVITEDGETVTISGDIPADARVAVSGTAALKAAQVSE